MWICRIDEKPGNKWDLGRVAVDALGAAMLVTIILDLWRIFLGPIVPIPEARMCPQAGLPWFSGHANLTWRFHEWNSQNGKSMVSATHHNAIQKCYCDVIVENMQKQNLDSPCTSACSAKFLIRSMLCL